MDGNASTTTSKVEPIRMDSGHALDLARHAGEECPETAIAKPSVGTLLSVDPIIVSALPIAGTKVLASFNYGMSLWGKTAKLICELPSGQRVNYFLKMTALGELGKDMTIGEFESLKAMHEVSPTLVPEMHSWGKFEEKGEDVHFLLAEFRDVGKQPPDAIRFTKALAEMHRNSVSPTGKFGFHVTTCHAKLRQITNCWEESWSVLYRKQLAHMVALDLAKNGPWPEFKVVCDITLEKVIPRLLEPLQSEGRSIKPCLIHGDLWDENTATDMNTGQPFIFDASSMYAHNEYEIGNWRAPRHRLSNQSYVRNYKRNFPVSEPEEEWDDRNELYSLRYDLATAVNIPGSNLRKSVFERMTRLCHDYFPNELKAAQEALKGFNGWETREGR